MFITCITKQNKKRDFDSFSDGPKAGVGQLCNEGARTSLRSPHLAFWPHLSCRTPLSPVLTLRIHYQKSPLYPSPRTLHFWFWKKWPIYHHFYLHKNLTPQIVINSHQLATRSILSNGYALTLGVKQPTKWRSETCRLKRTKSYKSVRIPFKGKRCNFTYLWL